MYEVQTIQDEFMGLVGMRQTLDPRFSQLSSDIVKTSSNVLLQHPLINIENLDMTARNYAQWPYNAWDNLEEYALGDRVKVVVGSAQTVYESIQDSNTGHIVTDGVWWKVVNLISLYLEDIWRNSIDEVVNGVMNAKKLRRESKTVLSNVVVYEGAGQMGNLIINESSLVGFQINLKYNRNLMAIIRRIGHQFTQAGDFDMYLYHSSQIEPIMTIPIVHAQGYSFAWTIPADDIKLHHILDQYDAGGNFYLMYDQDEIPGQAVKKNHIWGRRPCASCSGFNIRSWNLYSKFVSIIPVQVKNEYRNRVDNGSGPALPDNLWDITKTQFPNETNFGLNFEFNVRCDLTEMLLQNKDVFAFAIRDMVTMKLLESMGNSTRQNVDQTKVAQQAIIALQSKIVGGAGLRDQVAQQIKAVDFEFSDLNDVCLPCNNANGLHFGSIGLSRR